MPSDPKNIIPVIKAEHCTFDVDRIASDFPILAQKVHGHPLVYLDNAATTHKPRVVIDALKDYYYRDNSNIHRGLHTLADRATTAFEKTRAHVADFIGGVSTEEVIFTSGTTEAINLVAYSWGEKNISEGDEIVLTDMEHHANLVPWVLLAKRKGAIIRRIPLTTDGLLDLSGIDNIISERTKLVAVCHMSNVLGTINPVAEIAKVAHANGALILVDGAQAAPHLPVNVKELDADFYTLSAHKMVGPSGVGVLYAKRDILEQMPPFILGGEMIRKVSFDEITFAELPHKFEAGTPNIADVIAFDTALTYLEELGLDKIRRHEMMLTGYALSRLTALPGLEIQGPTDTAVRGGVISFTQKGVHPHDIGTYLDAHGIAVRAGHHCAQPLMKTLGKVATARASLYIYNDENDIERLVEALDKMRSYFGA